MKLFVSWLLIKPVINPDSLLHSLDYTKNTLSLLSRAQNITLDPTPVQFDPLKLIDELRKRVAVARDAITSATGNVPKVCDDVHLFVYIIINCIYFMFASLYMCPSVCMTHVYIICVMCINLIFYLQRPIL